METLFRRGFSREEMTKRVARFKDLNGSDGGLPDSNMPGCERTLFNVIGFQPPKGEGDAVTSPVGGDAAAPLRYRSRKVSIWATARQSPVTAP